MILIVGLGNPGEEFKNTRHNLGFDIVDIIHKSFTFPKFSKKFDGVFAKKNIYDNNVILCFHNTTIFWDAGFIRSQYDDTIIR